ncbi:hypothetical protein H0G86_005076 [Trichoderma simmonsii]|uniref:Carrier domain-containing protein n=1 Tax=Trichoderma simmonsii TaxID=1491479 RepID=A0A8G0L913_9HYPO|nr:hypothetical protein H0G86_005076 [Trichoderma simmonsii]
MELGDPLCRIALVEEDSQHYFVLTLHHAIYDGWSLGLFMSDVRNAYKRFTTADPQTNGTVSQRPAYNNFIRHLQTSLTTDTEEYWSSYLGGSSFTTFPTLSSSTREPVADTTIEMASTVKLQSGITMSTLIRAALGIVIGRYTDSTDVVFGAVSSGRNIPVAGIEGVIGNTIATVPVRAKFSEEQLIQDYLEVLQREATDIVPHEQLGLRHIAQMNEAGRAACGFQTLLIVSPSEEAWLADSSLGKWELAPEQQNFTTYAVTLECKISKNEVKFKLDLDSRVVDNWMMKKMLEQLCFILEQLSSASPTEKIGSLNTLTPEHKATLWKWNSLSTERITGTIQELFDERVRARPEAQAVAAWDGSLTYSELDALSTKLARHLVKLGVGSTSIVPLFFEKSMWTVVAVMGVLKTGAAFALVDIGQPEHRMQSIIKRCGSKIVCTSEDSQVWAKTTGLGIHFVVVGPNTLEEWPETGSVQFKPDPSSPLYICFTSGSTGEPKGIVIPHASFCAARHHQLPLLGFDENSRVFDFAGYSFDVAVHNVLTTLTTGGCLCVPSDEQKRTNLSKAMGNMGVNLVNLTQSVARFLEPQLVPSLQTLLLLGEAANQIDLERLWGQFKIINTYGPAECTPISTINATAASPAAAVGIGKGEGIATWVVNPDNHERLSPLGATGELLLEGPILATGYLNDPEKTAAAFISDPTWLSQGTTTQAGRSGRLYKTGDLVRYQSDGSLLFVGRKDTQVKIRGQRLELGEVEHNVRECLLVAQEVVTEVIIPGGKKDNAMLAAFITSESLLESQTVHFPAEEFPRFATMKLVRVDRDVSESLTRRLPSYMVPSIYFHLDNIPLTASGKTDRKQLRELGSSLTPPQVAKLRKLTLDEPSQRRPQTQTELTLQKLWATTMNLDPGTIFVGDSFFRLGGDSIAAMKLVAAARKSGINFSVSEIFQHPTLASQAKLGTRNIPVNTEARTNFALLSRATEKEELRAELAAIYGGKASDVEDAYPCTPLQEGLLSLSAKSNDYLMQAIFTLGKDTNPVDLRAAWEKVVLSTPILRTRVVQHPDLGLVQVVCRDGVNWITAQDLDSYLNWDKEMSMGLGDRLSRVASVDDGSGRVYIVWTVHHALYDGWSLRLLADNISSVYAGGEVPTSAPFSNFVDYIAGVDASAAQDYWRTYLEGGEFALFPSRFVASEHKARYLTVQRDLDSMPENADITTSTLLRCALAVVLSQYTGSNDVLFGCVVFGRNAAVNDIEGMVGPTIATVPVRVQVLLNQTIRRFLSTVQKEAAEMIAYEQVGLQQIAKMSDNGKRAVGFQTLLIVQPEEEDLSAFEKLGTWRVRADDDGLSTYAITIECTIRRDRGVTIKASFDNSVLEFWQVEKLLKQLDIIRDQLARAGVSQLLSEVSHATEDDVKAIWDWNRNAPTSAGKSINGTAKGSLEKSQHKEIMGNLMSLADMRLKEGSVTWIASINDPNHLVPIGAVGELLIEVPRPTIIDVNANETTGVDEFIEDPTWLTQGPHGRHGRLYKTGQLVRYNRDGDLFFVGRKDAQVSIRGRHAEMRDAVQKEQQQPLTDMELRLRSLWADVLAVEADEIWRDDEFLLLGGDSIAAMKLASMAYRNGLSLTVPDIFNFPMLEMQARIMLDVSTRDGTSLGLLAPFSLLGAKGTSDALSEEIAALSNLKSSQVEDAYPCTALQEGFMSLNSRRSGDYVMQAILKISETVQSDFFQDALDAIIGASPLLRTRIVQHDTLGLIQVVCRHNIGWTRAEDLDAYLETDKNTPMGLGDDLARFALIANGDTSWLVCTLHHAIYDGFSLRLLSQRVLDIYQQKLAGKANGIIGSPESDLVHFRSFIHYLVSSKAQAERAPETFWDAYLADGEFSPFPILPPGVVEPLADEIIEVLLPTASLMKNTRTGIATSSTLIKGALALLINQRTNSSDVVFGAVVSGRNAPVPGIDAIVGPTVATVPVRVRFTEEQSIQEYLEIIQKDATRMIEYEQTGLQRISKLGDSGKEACAFQTLLIVQPEEDDVFEGSTAFGTWQTAVEHRGLATYAVTLECLLQKGGSVKVRASFDTRVIKKRTMQVMLEQFGHLLEQLSIAEPGQTVEEVNTMPTAHEKMIWSWNRSVPDPVNESIPELIYKQVIAQPEAQAVVGWNGELSYAQLDDLTTTLALHLVERGVGHESPVLLLFEKSIWMIVASLGVLKAGGVCVPLDPTHTATERRHIIIEKAHARFILTSESFEKSPLPPQCTAIAVSQERLACMRRNSEEQSELHPGLPLIQPNSAAYIMFTSGSTGVPKGIVLEHRALATSFHYHGQRLLFKRDSRVLQFASYAFDVSVGDILATLLNGGCLCVPSEEQRMGDLAAVMEAMGVNMAALTPTVSRLLQCERVPSLKTLVLGGEPLTSTDYEKWGHLPNLINSYGPTEASVVSVSSRHDDDMVEKQAIGRALGCVIWIVNPSNHDRLTPIGGIGELLIEGDILSRGYLNDKERTAASFIQDPTWLLRGGEGRRGRLYKSGDLVRLNEDATLSFISRKDTQVKIRGLRVELGEVEHRVSEKISQAVGHIAVEVVRPAGEGSKPALAAFLAVEAHNHNGWYKGLTSLTSDIQVFEISSDILEALHQVLPSYMVPSVFFRLDILPLLSSGKTNRRKLREMIAAVTMQDLARAQTIGEQEKRQPATETERRLRQICARVLNLDETRVGVDDSFFRLGGDSVGAMQLSSAVRTASMGNLPVPDIFRMKTISRLAAVLDSSGDNRDDVGYLDDVPSNEPFPLSPMQNLLLQQEGGAIRRVDQGRFFMLRSRIDPQNITRAIKILVERHPMLRARFHQSSSGEWEQSISGDVRNSFYIQHVKVEGKAILPVADMLRSCREALDIENGPLLVVATFDDDDSQRLFIAIHSLVMDRVSWRILIQEFEELLSDRGVALPSSRTSFRKWVLAQARHVDESLEAEIATLIRVEPTLLSYWNIEPNSNIEGNTCEIKFTLDGPSTEAILGHCNDVFATRPNELMIAALIHSFAAVFNDRPIPAVYSKERGSGVGGRAVGPSNVIGCFTTLSPVQVQQGQDVSLLDVIRQTKDFSRARPKNGWLFLASRFANASRGEINAIDFPAEIVFDYAGSYQQPEVGDSVFKHLDMPKDSGLLGSTNVQRIAIFQIMAGVDQSSLTVSLNYPRGMAREDQVNRWMREYLSGLKQMAHTLQSTPIQSTLSDFPMAFQSYDDLDDFHKHLMPKLHVSSLRDIEDIYPCSPLQEGILISQSKDRRQYWNSMEVDITASDSAVNTARIEQAWRLLVKRHALLRALLVNNIPGNDRTMHVILRDPEPEVYHFESEPVISDGQEITGQSSNGDSRQWLQHRLSIYRIDAKHARVRVQINHAILDGYSLDLLARDFVLAYKQNEISGSGASYRDFIEYIMDQSEDEQEAFWKKRLEGAEPCHYPASGHCGDGTQPLNIAVPDIDANAVHAFCSHWEVTTAAILQVAWALVLRAYTGLSAPCFGTLTSGRDTPIDGVESVFGPLIGMIPSRVNLDNSRQVVEVVRDVQRNYVDSLRHQSYPLMSVHRLLKIGPSGLFNSVISFQRGKKDSLELADGSIVRFRSGQQEIEYDISIDAIHDGASIDVLLNFKPGFVPCVPAHRLAGALSQAIRSITTSPSLEITNVSLLAAADIEQLWSWNATVPEKVERCVHHLFEEQAQRQPEALALSAWDGELTYGDLNSLSSSLCQHLVARGIGSGSIVPLCFEKSMWALVATLAVLKAGGAFVPLDPSSPPDRRQLILQQTDAKLVLVSRSNANIAIPDSCAKLILDRGSLAGLAQSNGAPASQLNLPRDPNSMAYIIFTSGSTGTPKGPVVSHAAICSAIRHQAQKMGHATGLRVYDFASYTFDASLQGVFMCLAFGGCVCVPSEWERKNNLTESMRSMKANIAHLTPSVARTLERTALPDLRTIVLGGEAPQDGDKDWPHHIRVINTYGPAETTPTSTINSTFQQQGEITNMGFAAGSVTWIVDPKNHNQLMPIGSVGELMTEGPIVGGGYLGELEKTAAVFIENPRWLVKGGNGQPGRQGRVYKTGDLVRYKEDGSLIYIARKDTQVKVRGQRVELAEIEHQLRSCMPHASDIVVDVITPHGESNTTIVAAFISTQSLGMEKSSPRAATKFVAVAPGIELMTPDTAVESRLAASLPSYMIPSVYFHVANMPLTSSGKTDRRRLKHELSALSAEELAALRTKTDREKRPPRTEMERSLRDIWAGLLNVNPSSIGIDDSFIRLGGDSIAAMKVVGEARKVGLNLEVADMFRHPSLELVASQGIQHDASRDLIPRIEHNEPVEQSFAQERLWFLEQLYPGLVWYNMPCILRIHGSLQLDALSKTIKAIQSRHETLRTTFYTQDGVNLQHVNPVSTEELSVVQIARDGPALADAIRRDVSTPFDLRTEPGCRIVVYGLDENDHILSVILHHIISDGWSNDVLQREMATFYSAFVRNENPLDSISPLPIQYRDYSVWQRQQEQIDEHQRQLEYWVEQLHSSQPAVLLADKPRPATLSGNALLEEITIDGRLFDDIKHFCRKNSVTPFVLLLAAFRATHYLLTGSTDATIGTPNANRNRWEVKDIIGFFVNLQCIRIKIEDQSFEELISHVQSTVAASFDNQDVPFEKIVAKLQEGRDLSRHPVAQIMFALHSYEGLGNFTFEGTETEAMTFAAATRYDLEVHVFQEPERFRVVASFSTDLYEPETLINMLSLFRRVLTRGIAEPTVGVSRLLQLSENESVAAIGTSLSQAGDKQFSQSYSVIDAFRQQVIASPDRIAIEDQTTELTYAQLEAESDIFAHRLNDCSLPAETPVAIYSRWSCQTIVAIFGVLKANLAYVPLDSSLPAARIDSILKAISPGRILVLVESDTEFPLLQHDGADLVRLPLQESSLKHIHPTLNGHAAVTTTPSATSLACILPMLDSPEGTFHATIEHRGISRLATDNHAPQALLLKASRVALMTSMSHDSSLLEMYGPLLQGGTLVCTTLPSALNWRILSSQFEERRIEVANFTTTLLRQCLFEHPSTLSKLRILLVHGGFLEHSEVHTLQELLPGKFYQTYGRPELSGVNFLHGPSLKERSANGLPIGRATLGSEAQILDPVSLQPVPLGVLGELVVTGDGIARVPTEGVGATSRFIQLLRNGQRVDAYRTGDYGRQRPTDGLLEIVRRETDQMDLRSHRVDGGVIESILREHSRISDAAVVVQKLGQNENQTLQLASFVTLNDDEVEEEQRQDERPDRDANRQVELWEAVFNTEMYGEIDSMQAETLGRDFLGWNSAYDGNNISRDHMNEWLDDTIAAILNGGVAGDVLEVGTGSGMILFNLAKGMRSYIGIEPSERALDFIVKSAKTIPSLQNKLQMIKGTAADVSKLRGLATPTLAVINSVAQYFPSQKYLLKVVEDLFLHESIETIFFGDIRSHALRRQFQATKAMVTLGESVDKEGLRRAMEEIERTERELLIDPAFFTALTSVYPNQIRHVEILPKRVRGINELSCYRYSAVLHLRSRQSEQQKIYEIRSNSWIDFVREKLDGKSLFQLLRSAPKTTTIAVGNIPYKYTFFERLLVDSLEFNAAEPINGGAWASAVRTSAQECPSLSAIDLVDVAQSAGWRVEISWAQQSSRNGALDAVFHNYVLSESNGRVLFNFPTDHGDRPLHSLSNHPLRQQLKQKVQGQLLAKMKSRVPYYMVPQTIKVLDALPLGLDGHIDRQALAQETQQPLAITTKRQPTTKMEDELQVIWSQVLALDRMAIGLDDSFFQLGGDSISAMRVVADARKIGIDMTVADIFRYDTVAALSQQLQFNTVAFNDNVNVKEDILLDATTKEILLEEINSLDHMVSSRDIADILPATNFQEKTVVDGIAGGQFCNYFHLDLGKMLNLKRLKISCLDTIERFPILRTCFLRLRDQYWQVVVHQIRQPLRVVDVRADLDQSFHEFCQRDMKTCDPNSPPTAFVLLKHKEQGYRLVVRLSHAQYDGVCLPVIFESLIATYNSRPLAPIPTFSTLLSYSSRHRQKYLEYWTNVLKDCPPPPVWPKTLFLTQPSETRPVLISATKETSLPKMPGKVTSATLANAAWAVLMSRITGSSDVVYGYVVAGRNSSLHGVERIVGPCLNLIPIRARISLMQTPERLLESITQQFVQVGETDSLGFKDILENCTSWPSKTDFASVIQFQNIDENPRFMFHDTESRVQAFENPNPTPPAAPSLSVMFYPRGDQLVINLRSNSNIMTAEVANILLDCLCKIKDCIASDLQGSLFDLIEGIEITM